VLSRPAVALRSVRTREISRDGLATLGFLVVSAVICAVGAAVRLLPSSLHGLWLDESTSLTSALEPRPDQVLISAVLHESHPPLYNLLLWVWIHLAPSVEGARLLSVLAGTVAIALAMLLAAAFWGRWAALIAGALGAVSPWHAYYSAEIRMYALESALGMLTVYSAWRAIKRGSRGDWVLYAISALAFAWSDFYALFALAGLVAWTCLRARHKAERLRGWTVTHVAVGLGVIPLLPLMVGALIRGAGSGDRSGIWRLATLLADFGAGFAAPAWVQVAGATCAVVVVGLTALRIRSDEGLALIGLFALLPIAAMFAAGLFKPVWVERSLLYVVPVLWVMAAGILVKGAAGASTLMRSATAVAVLSFGLVELAAFQGQLTDNHSTYQRVPSARAYEFVVNHESQGERFLNADVATAAPLSARDRLNHRMPLQWEVASQRRPQMDVLAHSGAPGWLANYLLQLQGRLAWDPAARRVTYSEIDAWSRESRGFWLVVIEQSEPTMSAPTERLDARLAGGSRGNYDFRLVASRIPSEFQQDQSVEIEGTLFVHYSWSNR
jgi:dolichyl-phosphate-mannose-protein mannosyltransferase